MSYPPYQPAPQQGYPQQPVGPSVPHNSAAPPPQQQQAASGPREYRNEWMEYIRYIGFDTARKVCPEQLQYLFPNEAQQGGAPPPQQGGYGAPQPQQPPQNGGYAPQQQPYGGPRPY